MDIAKELQEAKQKQGQIVSQINMLEQRRQELIQEVLKTEGEIRILQRLADGQKENGVLKQKQGENQHQS